MTTVLHIKDLHKSFTTGFFSQKKKKILHGVSLDIQSWSCFALLWPNWAWKTTLIKCMFKFYWYESWDITLFGQKELTNTLLLRVWYAPDNTQYYDHLTWMENIIFSWRISNMTPEQASKTWSALLDRVWLLYAKDMFVKNYSAWMKKRLWIVISLLHDPDLIIWDEPMSWLDPLWRHVIKELIVDLIKKKKTLLFSTHILPDVESVADHFAILHQWKIVATEAVADIKKPLEDFFLEHIWWVPNNII